MKPLQFTFLAALAAVLSVTSVVRCEDLVNDVKRPLAAEDVEVTKDITYGTAAGEKLLLDLAMPKGLNSPAPAIVWIHGGGWRWGLKSEFQKQIVRSAQLGYVAVTITYRFAPKHIFPAQIEDCKAAVRWLRANAEKLHVDPQRIGAVGSSAGAHLSMLLATSEPSDGLEGEGGASGVASRVQVAVSYAGPTNLAAPFPEATQKILAEFLGGPLSEKQDVARKASPLTYVTSGDAPMLLIQGTKDPLVPFEQAYEMAAALTGAGVLGRVEVLLGAGHGWPKENARVERATFEFVGQYLKP